MWFALRREDLTFLGRAPVVHVVEAPVAEPRTAVFAALTDAASWPRWFPGVRAVRYASPPPHGVGTIREAEVGGTRWVEEMLAWDDGTHWAWTVLRASVPLAHAQVEAFAVRDLPSGTCVRWTLALEPRLLGKLGAPFTARTVDRLFHRAMHNLDEWLRAEAGARDGDRR